MNHQTALDPDHPESPLTGPDSHQPPHAYLPAVCCAQSCPLNVRPSSVKLPYEPRLEPLAAPVMGAAWVQGAHAESPVWFVC